MAGKTIILKPGQDLFLAGEKSDGMYLVRKGQLEVYLEQNGKEVSLAKVKDGSMIGEMALFDKKPRSASVKALTPAEVTLISNNDFAKLMKQIPNWFVGLMGTLSTRLRSTNERLQKVEAGIVRKPYTSTIRTLQVMTLLVYKDGVKVGKVWNLDRKSSEEVLNRMFGDDIKNMSDLVDILTKHEVLTEEADTYRNKVLVFPNRASLQHLTDFIIEHRNTNPDMSSLPEAGMEILYSIQDWMESAVYDTFSVSLQKLKENGKTLKAKTMSAWDKQFLAMSKLDPDFKLVKTDEGPGVKSSKKTLEKLLKFHAILYDMAAADLDQ